MFACNVFQHALILPSPYCTQNNTRKATNRTTKRNRSAWNRSDTKKLKDVGLTGGIAQVAAKIEVDGYVLLWYIVHAMILPIRVLLTDTIYIIPVKQM